MTPCERLLSLPSVDEAIKAQLRSQLAQLDPLRLLHDIRAAQHELAAFATEGAASDPAARPELGPFLAGLSSAWKDGEVRPTHRKNASAPQWWRTREDPFEHSWPTVQRWLEAEPGASAKELMERLAAMFPDLYTGKAQLRTPQAPPQSMALRTGEGAHLWASPIRRRARGHRRGGCGWRSHQPLSHSGSA